MSERIKVIYGAAFLGRFSDEEKKATLDVLEQYRVKDLDTAASYPGSEKVLGELGAPAKFVIHTKAPGRAPGSLKKESVLAAAEKSFTKLGVKTIESYFLHAPDTDTPIEETLDAIQEVYKSGKFKHFGLSNYQPEDVQRIYDYASSKGYVLPSVYQGNYNPVSRLNEVELFPLLRKLKMSFYAYSPLAGGFLVKTPEFMAAGNQGRWDKSVPYGALYHKLYNKPSMLEALTQWEAISKQSGIAKAALAYRWVAFNSQLTAKYGDGIIIGASRLAQLEETLKWLEDGPLDSNVTQQIEKVWDAVKDEAPFDNYAAMQESKL
ncbi:MAG: hypothetical protein Q9187_006242 [Circinaria calcarea]